MKKILKRGPLSVCMAFVLLLCGGIFSAAEAHRMHIYAWLQGSDVVVECAFNRSQPVIGGQVTVYDNITNRQLVQGRTNREGAFSFAVPDVIRLGHGLRIEVNAGQGHVSDWVMEANQLYDASAVEAGLERARIAENSRSAANGPAPAQPTVQRTEPAPAESVSRPVIANPDTPATRAHVHAIVNDALDAKLAPIHKRLAEMEDRGIGITEIFGGIGWLIGLFGIWFYYRGKRQ